MSHLTTSSAANVALLHGAGYVGGELCRLLSAHPDLRLATVTSRTYAGQPLHAAHASLRGMVDGTFVAPGDLDFHDLDAVVVAAEHGRGMEVIPALLDAGFEGAVVDLSADFRLRDASVYAEWYGTEHAAPSLLRQFAYGLPELNGGYAPGTRLVANPGCFATGLALALAPLAARGVPFEAHVTGCTGASGSGARPSAATHFPDRDGNVRAYNVLTHRHTAEVVQAVGEHVDLAFVPVSGPWTRGIWATVHVGWPNALDAADVHAWYAEAYAGAPCIRLSPGALPEMKAVVHTPFADLGWQVEGGRLVVGVALDNLLKGAASQAVQNLNLVLGLRETAGLLPEPVSVLESQR
jgi:N-acetyl-gamma-glutamyl-phosphate reductase